MAPSLMHAGLERAADRFPERVAILAGGDGWTFKALETSANAFARYLASRGVTPDSRVAVMMSNRPEFVVAVEAVSKLGAAAVLLNPAWKALEAEHALELTSPRHAVAEGPAVALLAEKLGEQQVSNVDVLSPAVVASAYSGAPVPADAAGVSRDAVLVFSSGTTGLPKSVRHTHHSMAWAIRHWRHALGLGPADRFQVATPPSHILGLLNLVTAFDAGATVRLHRRFDLEEVLYRIAAERMTLEMAVAPMALAMANYPDLERYDLSSLRYIMWGATPVTPSVAETVTRRTGVRWLPAYGASEVPVIAANPVAAPSAWRLDSAGLPPERVTLRVTELESGAVLGPGANGAIEVRSPSVMAGYLPDEANAEAFVDGWYRTGDVGWLEPEGWVHLTDRSKEMIKVSGFQVAPAELEAVLLGHVSVVDCAVFGVPDERAGEVPVAAVRLDPRQPVAPDDLKRFVADSLASYKRLHDVVVVDDIPRLPSGKVLRRLLRDTWVPPGREGGGQA
jgi:acyl-CoA synthetase (AMP-forming)/AMP-acid ligase II